MICSAILRSALLAAAFTFCCAGQDIDRSYSTSKLQVRWSPNGHEFAVLQPFSKLLVFDGRTGVLKFGTHLEPASIAVAQNYPTEWEWVPGKHQIVIATGTKLLLWERGTLRTLVERESQVMDLGVSPNGAWISFVVAGNLEVLEIASGQHTSAPPSREASFAVGSADEANPDLLRLGLPYEWSTDSRRVAYWEQERPQGQHSPYGYTEKFLGLTGGIFHVLPGAAIPRTRLCVFDLHSRTKKPLPLELQDRYVTALRWFRDSTRLLVMSTNRLQTEAQVEAIDIRTGATSILLQERDRYWIDPYPAALFTSNRQALLSLSSATGHQHVYKNELLSKQKKALTSGSWDVTRVVSYNSARGILFLETTISGPTERQVYSLNLLHLTLSRVTHDSGTHSVTMSPDGDYYLDLYSALDQPPRLSLMSIHDGNLRTIWSQADAGNRQKLNFNLVRIKTHDGAELDAAVVLPPHFEPTRRYPVIVRVGQGPGQQVVKDEWIGAERPLYQKLSGLGIVQLVVDTRGSGGHGHTYEEPIHYRLGAQETTDLEDVFSWLKRLPYVDQKRIGIWGEGYGGFLALRVMMEHSGRCIAGAAIAPIVDWRLQPAAFAERYLGSPRDHNYEYDQSSPLPAAGRLKGKLLVVSSTEDRHISFANTAVLQRALEAKGKQAEFVTTLSGRPDGPLRWEQDRESILNRIADFFAQTLQ